MSHPLLSALSDRALDDLRQDLYTAIRSDMASIMEPAFAKAWNNAWARLSGAPVVEKEAAQFGPPAVEKPTTARTKPFANAANRARWGASERIIRSAFATPGFKGMTPTEMSEWSHAHGEPVAASSIRTALTKMRKKGEVRVRQGKYSPRSPSGRVARDESPDADGPAPEDSRPNGSYKERSMPPP